MFFSYFKAIPEEPLSVNVSAKDINLVVKWQRNFDGGLKQSFYIEYKIKTNDQWSIIKSLNKSTSEILSWTINGLRHDQWYTVRMFSRNKLGESNRTEEIYIKTKGILYNLFLLIYGIPILEHMLKRVHVVKLNNNKIELTT